MLNNIRTSLRVITIVILPTFFTSIACAQSAIPSLGTGSCEIMIFSDYFCLPCERTATKAEPLIKELLATGKAKITFVDVQFNPLAPMYSKYYLYAFNANADVNNILKVRRTLFEAAQEKHLQTEDALVHYLKLEHIAIKPMNEASVYPLINLAIIKENIKTTPACIVRCDPLDEKKYVGAKEIINGLKELKKKLEKRKRNSLYKIFLQLCSAD